MTQSLTALMPTFPVPRTVGQRRAATVSIPYPKGWLWNFSTWDYVLGPDGSPAVCSGYVEWQQWCVFAVLTERFSYLAVPRYYGVDWKSVAQMDPEDAESHLVRAITEALMIDVRTGGVEDFVFDHSADSAEVTFTPRPADPAVGPPFTMGLILP